MARKSSTHPERSTSLDRVPSLADDCVMVVIETPKGSPNKLAFEPRYGPFVLKGVLPAEKRAHALVRAAMKKRKGR
jgi:hypothetical protein